MASLAAAEEAIELADAYGVADGNPLSESQKLTIRNAGGERADGTWAATRIADFGPRQGTGKNDKIAAWELAHLLLFGTDLIIHTAHEFPTANESFLRLVAVFEAWDDLRRKVSRIRYANGEQGIELRTGQRLKYRARTGGSGRGFAKAGLLVYDEAQHLSREHVAASGPAKLANPNSQTWYAGSGGLATSHVAWEIRRAAVRGTGGRLAYTEMTAETVTRLEDGSPRFTPPADVLDRDIWYSTIPGLGRWVTEEGVEALFDELTAMAPRELLCVWDSDELNEGSSEIPRWHELADPKKDGRPGSQVASNAQWALVVSPLELGPQWASFGLAGHRADGRFHVEALDHRAGTWWVKERAKQIYADKKIPLRMRPTGPENGLIKELREVGVEIEEVSSNDASQAFGAFIAATTSFDDEGQPQLHHLDDPDLNKAVKRAKRRSTSSGAASWDEVHSGVEITPLVAVTVALGGVPQVAPAEFFVY